MSFASAGTVFKRFGVGTEQLVHIVEQSVIRIKDGRECEYENMIQRQCPIILDARLQALMTPRITCNLEWERRYRTPSESIFSDCWCRSCRYAKVPGPYGGRGWERLVPEGQACCTEAWLGRGWFCRWCGRDEETGSKQAARGIYGGLSWDFFDCPSSCECGWELRAWGNFNLASCGSCWWICTLQLKARLFRLLGGGWSHIHELIWMFLIEAPQWGCDREEAVAARTWLLARIREYGLQSAGQAPLCQLSPEYITKPRDLDFCPPGLPCSITGYAAGGQL